MPSYSTHEESEVQKDSAMTRVPPQGSELPTLRHPNDATLGPGCAFRGCDLGFLVGLLLLSQASTGLWLFGTNCPRD